ncbi:type I secretion system permease/ATPase [Enterobacteriaceae bacterium C23F]
MSLDINIAALAQGIVLIANEHGIHATENSLRLYSDLPPEEFIQESCGYLGMNTRPLSLSLDDIPSVLFPAIASTKAGGVVVIFSLGESTAEVTFCDGQTFRTTVKKEQLTELLGDKFWIMRPKSRGQDSRIDEFLLPHQENWLTALIKKDLRYYGLIALAALFGNILALSSALFSMQVYDRVIPAQSFPTLWVLFSGVVFALLADMALKMLRSKLADALGKRIDIRLSSFFFMRALSIKNIARPQSTGAFMAQLREIEHIRELLTSTSVVALIDIPFTIMFIGFIAMIGGPLAFIPLAALPLIVIPGMLAQYPLAKLSREGLREGAVRNALLVESVEGVEDIKLLQAENRFLRLWERCNSVSSQVMLEQRHWASIIMNWTQFIQQLAYIGIIAAGVYLVIENHATTGTLIACSILSSRAVAPLAQLAQILTRWQHAKNAKSGLDELLKKPLDQKNFQQAQHLHQVRGEYEFRNVRFRFHPDAPLTLDIDKLHISPGERIAILGPIGAGKSSLLRLISGMSDVSEGELLLDGVLLKDIDVNDIRRNLAYLSQNATLFHGTLRDNLALSGHGIDNEQIANAINIAGAGSVLQHGQGLDQTIAEGGRGLSGGQQQAMLLARTILKDSRIVLLDEPTASMDTVMEKQVISALDKWSKNRTLIVVTHRRAPLEMVNRILVVANGRIVMDGPRDQVLKRLQG